MTPTPISLDTITGANDTEFGVNVDHYSDALYAEAVQLILEWLRMSRDAGLPDVSFAPMTSSGAFPRLLERALKAVDPDDDELDREDFLFGGESDEALGEREIRALEIGAGRV